MIDKQATLNKEVTRRFFKTDEGFNQLEQVWSKLMKDKVELNSGWHLLYAVLRGKDWRKGYSPITNAVKIENGANKYGALHRAFYQLRCITDNDVKKMFGDIFAAEVMTLVKARVNTPGYNYLPEYAYKKVIE